MIFIKMQSTNCIFITKFDKSFIWEISREIVPLLTLRGLAFLSRKSNCHIFKPCTQLDWKLWEV